MNSKQRAKLRSLASTIEPTTIIGKEGLSETVLNQLDAQLYARELVKVSVLEGAEISAKDCLTAVSNKLNAEQVCSIGRKFVVYRKSNKKGIKHIEF